MSVGLSDWRSSERVNEKLDLEIPCFEKRERWDT